jgi:hypothetical protein
MCALTSLFWLFGVLLVMVCRARFFSYFLCTVRVYLLQFAANTRAVSSKCGRCDVICLCYGLIVHPFCGMLFVLCCENVIVLLL